MILRLLISLLLSLALASPSWARIAFDSGGAVGTGTTSLTLAFPATVTTGDLLALCVTNKYPTNGPTLPTDAFGGVWVAPTNGQASGGFGIDGADLGHVYSTWYYKLATGTETGNLTVTVGSGNSSAGKIQRYRNGTGSWLAAAANGAANLSSLSWSATAGTDPDVTTNDMVVTCSGSYTDTSTFTVEALSQTGVTFGTMVERIDVAVTDGDDMRIVSSEHPVTAGPSSAADLTFTATASALTGGSTAFLRLREVASTVTFGSIGTASAGSTSVTPVAPATVNAGDLLVLCVVNKYPPNGPSTPTDAFGGAWAAVTNGQASGGNDPDGVDDGHVFSTLYVKTATGTEDSGNVSVTITSGNVTSSNILRYTNTTGAWLTAGTNGEDATTDTSWSVTGAQDPGVQAGDIIVTCSGLATDVALMTETTEVLTQTGIIYGLGNERFDASSGVGDDVGIKISGFYAISGTSSDVPTFVATLTSGSSAGSTAFVRIRQDSAAAAVSQPAQGFLGVILP